MIISIICLICVVLFRFYDKFYNDGKFYNTQNSCVVSTTEDRAKSISNYFKNN